MSEVPKPNACKEVNLNPSDNAAMTKLDLKRQRKANTEKLWQKSGFQRILAGYWHNYAFMLATLVFGLVIAGVIFPNYILPFPEAMGFRSVVSSLFALLFTVFDIGIGSAVTRFMAEQIGKGKIQRSLEYARFFIWFQMVTGLLQVTFISIWALYFAKQITQFSYLIWMFLLYSTVQYPGMLGVYKSALQSFQRYDKANIVSFVQSVFLESTTQIVFIFIGRAWGVANPQYGEMVGATLGYIIGLYIDDFLAMLLSAKFFADILKPYGISIKETLKPTVPKEIVKESLIFGLKNMAQSIFYQISMLMITAMTISWLPNYATIIGLFSVADGITRIVVQDLPAKASIAESYNCGKINLTKYYTTATFKWYGLLTFVLAIGILQLIPPIIADVAANYAAAATMIPYLMVSRIIIGPIHFSDSVHQGCDKPEYAAYSLAVQMVARAISFWIFLSPSALPSLFENYNLVYAYCLADFPAVVAKNVFAWWIVNKKLYKIKVNLWQTIITPLLSLIPLYFLNIGFMSIYKLLDSGNLIVVIAFAMFLLLFMLFGAPTLIYFPMLGLLGGWDPRGLEHLRDAADMSGPSKIFVILLYKGASWGFKHTPFRKMAEKNVILSELADKEAAELVHMRELAQVELKNGNTS